MRVPLPHIMRSPGGRLMKRNRTHGLANLLETERGKGHLWMWVHPAISTIYEVPHGHTWAALVNALLTTLAEGLAHSRANRNRGSSTETLGISLYWAPKRTYSNLTTTLRIWKCHHTHLIDEQTEAQESDGSSRQEGKNRASQCIIWKLYWVSESEWRWW